MRSLKHWTPIYIYNRIIEKCYRKTHSGEPWLTPQAIRFLEYWIKPGDMMLEFGSGRSTIWFANRVNTLVSVEHDPDWYARVAELIKEKQIQNIIYVKKSIEGSPAEYTQVPKQFENNSLDLILIDGRLRDICANECLSKLKPGGLMILDNADVYLPSQVMTPNSHPSRVQSPAWQTFMDVTGAWRQYWTCNGVSATTFFFKPC